MTKKIQLKHNSIECTAIGTIYERIFMAKIGNLETSFHTLFLSCDKRY